MGKYDNNLGPSALIRTCWLRSPLSSELVPATCRTASGNTEVLVRSNISCPLPCCLQCSTSCSYKHKEQRTKNRWVHLISDMVELTSCTSRRFLSIQRARCVSGYCSSYTLQQPHHLPLMSSLLRQGRTSEAPEDCVSQSAANFLVGPLSSHLRLYRVCACVSGMRMDAVWKVRRSCTKFPCVLEYKYVHHWWIISIIELTYRVGWDVSTCSHEKNSGSLANAI